MFFSRIFSRKTRGTLMLVFLIFVEAIYLPSQILLSRTIMCGHFRGQNFVHVKWLNIELVICSHKIFNFYLLQKNIMVCISCHKRSYVFIVAKPRHAVISAACPSSEIAQQEAPDARSSRERVPAN